MVSLEEFERANLQAQRSHGPTAVAARYDRRIHRVVVRLNTGLEIAFSPGWAQGLEHAHWQQLTPIEISPSGLGLHFPQLDADLYLPALLEGVFGSKSWMAAQLGAQGGRARSAVKTQASRENGKRGGRPKTQVA